MISIVLNSLGCPSGIHRVLELDQHTGPVNHLASAKVGKPVACVALAGRSVGAASHTTSRGAGISAGRGHATRS
jgi:hypothetical protein